MSNREISRERSEEDRGTAAASQANEATARNEGNNIYVSNLAPTTDDEALKEVFGAFGELKRCQIVREPITRDSRGFAFVAFVMLEDSDRAIEALNGSQLAGRTIKVEKARRGGGYEKTPGRYLGPRQANNMGNRDGGSRDRGGYDRGDRGGYDRGYDRDYGRDYGRDYDSHRGGGSYREPVDRYPSRDYRSAPSSRDYDYDYRRGGPSPAYDHPRSSRYDDYPPPAYRDEPRGRGGYGGGYPDDRGASGYDRRPPPSYRDLPPVVPREGRSRSPLPPILPSDPYDRDAPRGGGGSSRY